MQFHPASGHCEFLCCVAVYSSYHLNVNPFSSLAGDTQLSRQLRIQESSNSDAIYHIRTRKVISLSCITSPFFLKPEKLWISSVFFCFPFPQYFISFFPIISKSEKKGWFCFSWSDGFILSFLFIFLALSRLASDAIFWLIFHLSCLQSCCFWNNILTFLYFLQFFHFSCFDLPSG